MLGLLLWNTLYDKLLCLKIPKAVVTIVAFADNVVFVINAKYLEDINNHFNVNFAKYRRQMELVGQKINNKISSF